MDDLVVIGRDKRDPSLLTAYIKDTEYPLVHARLEFRDEVNDFAATLTFCPIIDSEKDEESQRRICDKLKIMIMDSVKPSLRYQLNPHDEQLCVRIIKDGKYALYPLPNKKPTETPPTSQIITPGNP